MEGYSIQEALKNSTPGPWKVYQMGNYYGVDAGDGDGTGPNDRTIITYGDADDDCMGVQGDSHEQMKANAYLIACAPETTQSLLSAYERIEHITRILGDVVAQYQQYGILPSAIIEMAHIAILEVQKTQNEKQHGTR